MAGANVDLDALLADDDFDALFSQMESVVASEGLKSRTLGAMMAAVPDTAPDAGDGAKAPLSVVEGARPSHALPKASRRRSRRPPFRRIVAMAAAASLALGAIGAAYAIPTTYVSVEGSSAYELGVDIFGVTVSATASDEAGRALLADASVCNRGYGDSIEALLAAIADESVCVTVSGDNVGQRAGLSERSSSALDGMGREGRVRDVEASVRDEARDAGMPVGRYIDQLERDGRGGADDAPATDASHVWYGDDGSGRDGDAGGLGKDRAIGLTGSSRDGLATGDADADAGRDGASWDRGSLDSGIAGDTEAGAATSGWSRGSGDAAGRSEWSGEGAESDLDGAAGDQGVGRGLSGVSADAPVAEDVAETGDRAAETPVSDALSAEGRSTGVTTDGAQTRSDGNAAAGDGALDDGRASAAGSSYEGGLAEGRGATVGLEDGGRGADGGFSGR